MQVLVRYLCVAVAYSRGVPRGHGPPETFLIVGLISYSVTNYHYRHHEITFWPPPLQNAGYAPDV